MRSWLKTIMVAAMVGVLALATVAVAQTDSPESDEKEKSAEERRDARRDRIKDRRHRDGCGRHFGPKARKMVYSETKIQTEDGFALLLADVGEVTAVSESSITIQRADGETVSATANDETKVCYQGEKASLGDIQVGDKAALRRVRNGDETGLKAVFAGTPKDGESDEAPAGLQQSRPLELLDG